MRQRVLTVTGLAVGLLVVYTLLFGTGVGGDGGDVLAGRIGGSIAARAAPGATDDDATPAPEAGDRTPRRGAVTDNGEPEPVIWGSDPFVRDWLLHDELAELTLKAITIGGERAYVLINDQILERGDVIGGKRIVAIESDKVILEHGGRTFALMLGE